MGEFIDKLKGKVKQVEGDLTGDRSRHAEGRVDEAKGKAKGAFEDVKQDAKRAIDRVEDKEKHE